MRESRASELGYLRIYVPKLLFLSICELVLTNFVCMLSVTLLQNVLTFCAVSLDMNSLNLVIIGVAFFLGHPVYQSPGLAGFHERCENVRVMDGHFTKRWNLTHYRTSNNTDRLWGHYLGIVIVWNYLKTCCFMLNKSITLFVYILLKRHV